jgi:MFS family permease
LDQAPVAEPAQPLYTRNFWLVFAAHFALNLSVNLFVMLPLLVMRLGGGPAMIGMVIAAGGVAALAVRPLNGGAIDRFGCKWIAVRFLVLDALATALYIPLGSLRWPLFAVRAIHGAIDGTARVALFGMVYELLPAGRRGEAMATFTLCSMVPAAIAPLMGEEIVRALGFGVFFALAAALCLAAAMIASQAPPDRVAPAHSHPRPAQIGFLSMLRDRALMPLWAITLLWSIALAARSFVVPFAYQAGIARVGWYFMAYCGVAVVLRVFSASFLDQVGLSRVIAPTLVMCAAGLALLAFTGRFGALAIAALIGGAGHGYFYPALCAQVIGYTRPEQMGRSSAVFNSLLDFGAMAGPYAFGLVASAAGYAPMFLIAAAIALVAAAYYVAAQPAGWAGRERS